MADSRIHDLAERIAARALRHGLSVGVAESLTSGRVSAALGAAEDASTWFRGAVVAYASEVKFDVLGVPEGPVVTTEAALAMARGARILLRADVVVGVSGAGGPQPQDGRDPGTVCFGLVGPGAERSEEASFDGGPGDVVRAASEHALDLVSRALADHDDAAD